MTRCSHGSVEPGPPTRDRGRCRRRATTVSTGPGARPARARPRRWHATAQPATAAGPAATSSSMPRPASRRSTATGPPLVGRRDVVALASSTTSAPPSPGPTRASAVVFGRQPGRRRASPRRHRARTRADVDLRGGDDTLVFYDTVGGDLVGGSGVDRVELGVPRCEARRARWAAATTARTRAAPARRTPRHGRLGERLGARRDGPPVIGTARPDTVRVIDADPRASRLAAARTSLSSVERPYRQPRTGCRSCSSAGRAPTVCRAARQRAPRRRTGQGPCSGGPG